LAAVLSTTVMAEQHYVSLGGSFSIAYPDDWAQVDYRLVDTYLLQNKAGKPIFDYEAVFAMKDAPQFYSSDYLILTIDTVGELNEGQIDSVLNELSRSFGKKVKYFPVSDFVADLKSNTPSYDPETKTVTILNEIMNENQPLKKNLLMLKFYERGIATFYFYSPDSLFEASKSLFEQIAASFSTKNINALLPKEQLKLADLKDVVQKENSDKKSKNFYLYFGVALVLIILVVIRRLKRRPMKRELR